MDPRVRDLLAGLRDAESVGPQWDVVDEWVDRRELGKLREAAFALVASPEWHADSVLERIVKRLALTPDAEFAALVRDIAQRHDPPYLASLVAFGQRPEVAASVAQGEFGACLMQELVLRGAEPDESRWRRGHPLAWLPLRLAEIEKDVDLPHYSVSGSAYGMPFGPHGAAEGPDATVNGRIGRDITPATFAERAATAFADWVENSNGKVEARVFELEAGEFAGFTGLECLAGATTVRAWDASASDVFDVAFVAASTGGAYTRGRQGAYGRLDAWRTLAALVDAEPAAPFHEVSAAVSAARWFRFESDAPWFEGVAWDVGLAAEREDGRSLAVLAATDMD